MRMSKTMQLVMAMGVAAMVVTMSPAQPTSQTVVYQGELAQASAPYSGLVDLRVRLFDSREGGSAIGAAAEIPGVLVEEGRFSAVLPFPSSVYVNQQSLWLEIEVRGEGGGVYTMLTPRQALTAVPAARRAMSAASSMTATAAVHAQSATTAASAASVGSAQRATNVQQATHATLADLATSADSVPFGGITGNPWTLVGTGIRTMDRVGIGRSPIDVLDVVGPVRLNNARLNLRSGTFTEHQLGWFGTGIGFAGVTPDGPVLTGWSGGILGTVQGGARATVVWNSAGQVGIGTSNTQGATFAVNGTAASTAGGFWAGLSDPATKCDVEPLSGALERLMRLHGYEYEYEPRFVESGWALPGRQRGLMADEVARVFPDWVSVGDDGLRRVTERSTTALLVESLRELRAQQDREFDQLQERLRVLESELGAR